jgi:hypothetical protein
VSLALVPITYREACAFIERHHRHHAPSRGQVFAVAAAVGEAIVGVATAGRPVSRHLDDGWTLEVNRVATDGTRNACSFLYGAVRRIGKAMGYRRFVTYTLPEEGGASLRGAGWQLVGEAGGGSWDTPNSGRPRVDTHPTQMKLRWEATA